MATVSTNHSNVAHKGSWLLEQIATLRESFEAYRVFRRTLNELNALSNRELSDLGVNRSMISRLAFEAAYGKAA